MCTEISFTYFGSVLMFTADLMAFPFPQHKMMEKADIIADPEFSLDLFHATCVPPFVTDLDRIEVEAAWFSEQLTKNGLREKAILGLQNPCIGLSMTSTFE